MLWRFCKSFFSKEVITVLIFAGIYALFRLFGITCLFYKLTGIPCPACGMARAILSLFSGDFKMYLAYNAMAIPVAAVFLCELFNGFFTKYKNVLHWVSAAVLVINLVYYFIRLKYAI